MTQNVGQSRGSQKHKQFVQDSANSFVVEAFIDVSATAPVSPSDGDGYIVENVSSIDGSWGTITGLADFDIIRYRASKSEWYIVHKAIAANQGSKAYVKDEDTLYALDATAEWAVASGSGGGVKNFAQKQATGYKVADWTTGNNATFGTAGSFAGSLDIETVAPLDGKKSFKYTAAAGSQNDWFYILVDISEYARGGAIAHTFDYTWTGADNDISIEIWDPTFTNEYSTELNVLKDTTNDNKLSRNSRTIYAHPDTESQVIVGFQVTGAVTGGEELIFDNLKVTDDIGVIGQGNEHITETARYKHSTNSSLNSTTEYYVDFDSIDHDEYGIFQNSGTGFATDSQVNGTTTFHGLIQSKGKYRAYARWAFQDADLDNEEIIEARIRVNNVEVARSIYEGKITSGSTWYFGLHIDEVLDLNEGDIVEFNLRHTATENLSISGAESSMSFHRVGVNTEGLRFLSVPNGEKLKDVFSAKINHDGTIISQSVDFIDSVSKISTGTYNLNLKPGFFSQIPSMVVSTIPDTISSMVAESNELVNTTSLLRVRTLRSDTRTEVDASFDVTLQRQGTDTVPDIVGVPVSIQGQTHEADSAVAYTGMNGPGAGAYTKISKWVEQQVNVGSAITAVDEGGIGTGGSGVDSFYINETGLYHLSANMNSNASGSIGWIKNLVYNGASGSIPDANRLSITQVEDQPSTACTAYLLKGDVVRLFCDPGAASNPDPYSNLSIAKVGTQPLLDGGLVERPGFSISVQGAGESTATHTLTYSTTLINQTNDMFKYVQDTVEGDYFEILEDGVFDFSLSHADSSTSAQEFGICVNAPLITFSQINVNNPETVIANTRTPAQANATANCSGSRRLYKGDKVRAHYQGSLSVAAPTENYFRCTYAGQAVKYSSRVYKEDPIAWQRKVLSANVTSSTTVSDLEFNNLEIGKTYKLSARMYYQYSANNGSIQLEWFNGGNSVGRTRYESVDVITATGTVSDYFIFTATATTMTCNSIAAGTYAILGNGTVSLTIAHLEELPFHAQTSKWT